MTLTRVLGTAAAAAVLTVQAAMAGQCGYPFCWGAVAIGEGGAWGWAHSHYSEQAAINALQTECEWGCENLHTFYNGCGAISQGSSGNWGFGEGSTRESAEYTSLAYCSQYGEGCRTLVWACSQ